MHFALGFLWHFYTVYGASESRYRYVPYSVLFLWGLSRALKELDDQHRDIINKLLL